MAFWLSPRRRKQILKGISGGVVPTPPGDRTPPGEYGWTLGLFWFNTNTTYMGVDGTGFWIDEDLAGGKTGFDGTGWWVEDD